MGLRIVGNAGCCLLLQAVVWVAKRLVIFLNLFSPFSLFSVIFLGLLALVAFRGGLGTSVVAVKLLSKLSTFAGTIRILNYDLSRIVAIVHD